MLRQPNCKRDKETKKKEKAKAKEKKTKTKKQKQNKRKGLSSPRTNPRKRSLQVGGRVSIKILIPEFLECMQLYLAKIEQETDTVISYLANVNQYQAITHPFD